ncbi:MAG: MurR/RpiR family transcriptional regulator, partial [Cetobacterium sp.]
MENHKKSHLFLLHQQYDSLTTSEKKIADYILQNTSEIMETTIEKLSENCKTSIATISRFSKKLGFENFYHLKISIAKEFINP